MEEVKAEEIHALVEEVVKYKLPVPETYGDPDELPLTRVVSAFKTNK